MLIIIFRWIFLWATLYIVGRKVVVAQAEASNQEKLWYFFPSIWAGIGVLTLFLQFTSLFFPIGEKIVLITWLLITATIFFKEKHNYQSLLLRKQNLNKFAVYFLIFSLVVFVGLNFSIGRVNNYDAYLYHFNAVAWNKLYPIVPGLANLHFRLGFNSGIHLLAAFFEQGLPNGFSVFITNGFLLTTIFMQIFSLLIDAKTVVKQKIFFLLLLPFLWISLISGGAHSLSSDIAMMVMVFSWAITLIKYPNFRFLATLQATTVVIFKLSGLMILFSSLWLLFKEKKLNQLLSLRSYLFWLIIFGFLIRNVLLSGYLLFPNTLLKVPVEWLTPESTTMSFEEEIRGWAISPRENYLQVVNQNIFQWFPTWFIRNSEQIELKILYISLLVLAILLFTKKDFFLKDNEKIILFGTVMSIIFWFTKAPDFRFGSGFFYLLGSLVISIVIDSLKLDKIYKISIAFLIIFLVINLKGESNTFIIHDWQDSFLKLDKNIGKKELKNVKNINGYSFFEPQFGDQCGNQELLCAPYIDEIEFIDNTNLRKGFKLKLNE